MAGFVRENTVYCGDRIKEVSIINYTDGRLKYNRSGKRRKKTNVSAPKQQNLNDKNARDYLRQLLATNFSEPGSGYHVTLTYDRDSLPGDPDEADKIAELYLRRLKSEYKRRGAELKYIMITSYNYSRKTGELVRLHHHIVLSSGIDRLYIKNQWRKPLQRGEDYRQYPHFVKYGIRRGERYGICNCDELEPDDSGLGGLADYLKNQPREAAKRRWRSSQNLRKPQRVPPNDDKYSRRQVEKICKSPFDVDFWERKYPGWTVARPHEYSYEARYNDFTGWSIHLRLVKKPKKGGEKIA